MEYLNIINEPSITQEIVTNLTPPLFPSIDKVIRIGNLYFDEEAPKLRLTIAPDNEQQTFDVVFNGRRITPQFRSSVYILNALPGTNKLVITQKEWFKTNLTVTADLISESSKLYPSDGIYLDGYAFAIDNYFITI